MCTFWQNIVYREEKVSGRSCCFGLASWCLDRKIMQSGNNIKEKKGQISGSPTAGFNFHNWVPNVWGESLDVGSRCGDACTWCVHSRTTSTHYVNIHAGKLAKGKRVGQDRTITLFFPTPHHIFVASISFNQSVYQSFNHSINSDSLFGVTHYSRHFAFPCFPFSYLLIQSVMNN